MHLSVEEKGLVRNYRKANDRNKKAILWYAAISGKAKTVFKEGKKREGAPCHS